jgi:FkbM family methyltransferase
MRKSKDLLRSTWSRVEEIGMSRPVVRVIDLVSPDSIRFHGYRIATEGLSTKVKGALYWGFYESAELAFLKQHLRSDLDVVELGTSIGVVACHILSRIDPQRRLICVEASPKLTAMAARNITSNHPDRRVELLNRAVAYKTQIVRFQEASNNLEGKVSEDGTQVEAITLSDLLSRFQVEDYVLICDVEGAESQILHYDAQALARCRQMIIELHDSQEASIQQLADALTNEHKFSVLAQYDSAFCLSNSNNSLRSRVQISGR